MRLVAKTKQYAVYDDFLSEDHFRLVFDYMTAETFNQVTALSWNGAWRLDDGPVMRGPGTSAGNWSQSNFQYPSNTGIDLLVEAILNNKEAFEETVGKSGIDWDAFTAVPTLYPRDSGLYWHRDAANWTGSYTYYAHPEWNIQWGGELLIADESAQSVPEDWGVFMVKPKEFFGTDMKISFGGHFNNKDANEAILEKGLGTYVMAKPNRLVLIAGNNPHCVSKVTAAAGDHIRTSISGFFQRMQKK